MLTCPSCGAECESYQALDFYSHITQCTTQRIAILTSKITKLSESQQSHLNDHTSNVQYLEDMYNENIQILDDHYSKTIEHLQQQITSQQELFRLELDTEKATHAVALSRITNDLRRMHVENQVQQQLEHTKQKEYLKEEFKEKDKTKELIESHQRTVASMSREIQKLRECVKDQKETILKTQSEMDVVTTKLSNALQEEKRCEERLNAHHVRVAGQARAHQQKIKELELKFSAYKQGVEQEMRELKESVNAKQKEIEARARSRATQIEEKNNAFEQSIKSLEESLKDAMEREEQAKRAMEEVEARYTKAQQIIKGLKDKLKKG